MSVLLVERDDELKIITLNRPDKANALNAELVQAVRNEIDQSADDGTRLLVIRGNGRSFCSGFDLSNLDKSADHEIAERVIDVELMLQALHHAPFMTLALVQSKAFGAGADLVCCCHIRIAESGAKFCMPGLNFGVLLGTRRLVLRVGVDNAISLLVNTRVFDTDEALRSGFLTAEAQPSQWDDCIGHALEAATAVAGQNVTRMLSVVVPDTRDDDMAELIESVSVPGLVDRIVCYRNSLRAKRGKSLD